MTVFQDGANSLDNGNIHVTQATYKKQRNAPRQVKLKTGGNLFVSLGENAVYKDIRGNTILEGTIRKINELNKGGSESIYEVEIFDESHIFTREVLNEIYRKKTPEDILKDIVQKYGFTFQNNLPFTSNQNIDKKSYIDFKPLEAINELAETLNALWGTDNKKFILYQEGAEKSSIDLNEDGNWINPNGFNDDTDKQANSVIVRGQEILQRTSESFTGTKKVFTLSREPVDVEVPGLTQSTENINGDYSVDTQNKEVTFNNSQTDPTINYSYWSKIRVRSGQSEPVAQIERKYIETVFEARELARNYLDKYQDGITSAEFENSDLFDVNINNLRPGDRIDVKAKDPKRTGEYIINEIKRKYPKKTVVQIGEDLSSLWNWQKEARSRINQLEKRDRNEDFVQLDEFNKGSLSVDFTASFTDLYIVHNTGEILWASNTQFSNDADKIDNTSPDSDVALAYNEDNLPSGSVTDILGNSQSLQ